MLTEPELQIVKRLLKQKNHELWREPSNLQDLHRHCKYTIRKLTQQMANVDNYSVFKHLREVDREHTLYLVYRAHTLFKALAESEKIFKLISSSIFDQIQFDEIVAGKRVDHQS